MNFYEIKESWDGDGIASAAFDTHNGLTVVVTNWNASQAPDKMTPEMEKLAIEIRDFLKERACSAKT